MIYLLRSGEWYRVGRSDSRYVVDRDENPSLELLGQVPGGEGEALRWSRRMKGVCDEQRGEWYLLREERFIGELVGAFDEGTDSSPGGITAQYDMSEGGSSGRIVSLYGQFASWLESSPSVVESSAQWRSRLLGQCEVLRSLGSHVLRSYSSGVVSGEVRWHDGRVWVPLAETELRVALQYFCLDDLGVGGAEWIRNERRYLSSVREGAGLSPLRLSRAVVGFQNGVYDFSDPSSPVYHPFSDRLPVVDLLPYDYDATASCPLWMSFLAQVLPPASVEMLRRYLGLAMVDRRSMPYKVEKSLWLVGPGGAGKSTIMNVVRHVVGESRVSAVSLGALLSGGAENRARFAAAIDGKVFNYCGEVQMEDMTRGSDTFKSLCSGEPQMKRRIGGNVEIAEDIPFLVFNMNRKPRNNAIDDALMRRLLFVTFPTAVRDCDRDPQLEDRLKGEASGIRNWMLGGYLAFVDGGGVLSPTAESEREGDLWMAENGQSVDLYLRRMGYRPFGYTSENERSQYVRARVLYDGYYKWCSKTGLEPDVDLAGFGKELRRAGFKARRVASGMEYRVFNDSINR